MRNLFPDIYYDSTYLIDYEDMYRRGFRGILFDIDNTLVCHNAPQDEKSFELINRLHRIGYKTAVVSNNRYERVRDFAQPAGMYYVYKAGKPMGRGYREAIADMGLDAGEVFCVGDQIYTDVWGARRAGLVNFLVKPLGPESEVQIILKRIIEKPVLLFIILFNKHKKNVFIKKHPVKEQSAHE